MSERTGRPEDDCAEPDAGRDGGAGRAVAPRRLAIDVVTCENGLDRCTLRPPGLTGVRRMSCWLSADRSAFADLVEYR